MTFPVIYQNPSRGVLVVDPEVDANGDIVLPDGVDADIATLGDEQRAVLSTPDARFELSPDLQTIVAIAQPPDPRVGLKSQIINLAQSAVGISLADLTLAQRNALTAVMLFELGGVDHDLTVKPLGQWVR